jgi:hypothetical protein
VATGWPADTDLAAWLGLDPGDDAARVTSANAAAQAAAISQAELDPTAGPVDSDQWEAVLMLGAWWYQTRNHGEGIDVMNPAYGPFTVRNRAIAILRKGRPAVA